MPSSFFFSSSLPQNNLLLWLSQSGKMGSLAPKPRQTQDLPWRCFPSVWEAVHHPTVSKDFLSYSLYKKVLVLQVLFSLHLRQRHVGHTENSVIKYRRGKENRQEKGTSSIVLKKTSGPTNRYSLSGKDTFLPNFFLKHYYCLQDKEYSLKTQGLKNLICQTNESYLLYKMTQHSDSLQWEFEMGRISYFSSQLVKH